MCEGSHPRCSVYHSLVPEHSGKFSLCSDPPTLVTCVQVFVLLFSGCSQQDEGSAGMNYDLRIVLVIKSSVLLCLADARVVVVVIM
jgi:hypothetical protein